MKTLHHDYLTIGAGPAGLQLGYFLQKKKRDYAILESASTPGYFFKKFPRHQQLLSINKIHTGFENGEINLRWDWNSLLSDSEQMLFKHYSQAYFPNNTDMVKYLKDFATYFNINIKYGAKIVQTEKRNARFLLTDSRGRQYSCLRLIVATGVSQPYVPPIAGIEFTENYASVSINPKDFEGQRVLLIGKGNSAFEMANNLLHTTALLHLTSPKPITMAWRSHFVGHIRSVNSTLLDSYLLKSQNVLLDATVLKIERQEEKFSVTYHYSHANNEIETLVYDRVIVCTGFRFDASIFDSSCKPALVIDDRFPEMTSEWESTNVKGLYFAGTLTQSRDYKKKKSAFIHGFRYNIELLHRLFEQKYHGIPLAVQKMKIDPEALMNTVLQRINQGSSLWQQTGYFCDALVVHDGVIHYYNDLTVDYVHNVFGDCDQYYVVTLDFGQERIDTAPDPFAIERVHKDDSNRAELSTAIHPIIRRFSRKKLITTHHVIEDIARGVAPILSREHVSSREAVASGAEPWHRRGNVKSQRWRMPQDANRAGNSGRTQGRGRSGRSVGAAAGSCLAEYRRGSSCGL